MDYLTAIKHFIQVIDCGNFSAAAHTLNIPISKLSKEIKWLEEFKLKKTLIFRTTRRLEATPEGLVFYKEAKNILASVEQAETAINENEAELQGHIRISLSTIYSRSQLLDLITDFLKKHPKVTVESINENSPYSIVDKHCHIAISTHQVEHPRLKYQVLFETHRGLFASEHYLKAQGTPQSIEALKDHNCLVSKHATHNNLWEFSGNRHIKVNGNFTSSATTELINAGCKGLGILYLPKELITMELASGQLKEITLDEAPIKSTTYVYYESHAKNSAITRLVNYLVDGVDDKAE